MSLMILTGKFMIILRDKKDDWSFVKIGYFDISETKKETASYFSEWLVDTDRQKEFVTHEDTLTLQLRSFDYLWYVGEKSLSTVKHTLKNSVSKKELKNIYSALELLYNGKVIRSEIVNLKPYGRIRSHKDRGDNLYLGRRIHVPIKTNHHCTFEVGNESIVMQEGCAYEINNSKYHKVSNYYSQNRIHLIVDVMPSEYIDGIVFEEDTL